MFTIDVQSRVPVWEQIVSEVQKYVLLGIIKPDDRIPSIRELSVTAGINPNTITKAYTELARTGIVTAAGGRGYFVSRDVYTELKRHAEAKLPEFMALSRELILSGIDKKTLTDIINCADDKS